MLLEIIHWLTPRDPFEQVLWIIFIVWALMMALQLLRILSSPRPPKS